MLDLDTWRELFHVLSRNKLRTSLTALGVFWGMFMLIVLLGLGRGLEAGATKNLGGWVQKSVFVGSGKTSLPFRGRQPGRHLPLRDADIGALERVPGVVDVAPRLQLGDWRDGGNVVYGAKNGVFSVMGDRASLRRLEPFRITAGRFLNERDEQERRKVAVVGPQIRRVLFDGASPMGAYIMVSGQYFLVVGELASDRGGEEGDHIDNTVFIPFSTFQYAFNRRDRVGWFVFSAAGETVERVKEVQKAALRTLALRHDVHPEDAGAFWSFNAAERVLRFEALFRGIRRFVWVVGIVTLLSGVLGVSNVLLITVRERTRELGLRRALGATRTTLVSMIVREALVLTAVSGYAGLVAGVLTLEALGRTLSRLPNAPLQAPEVALSTALWALAILVVSGIAAAIVPARHAASISPVEALRTE
ncbi:MAG TPA: ABC transporter permease [Polyangiaceae bacterium]|nr:ABC transporter permease [Polyangiaceae bacterium]